MPKQKTEQPAPEWRAGTQSVQWSAGELLARVGLVPSDRAAFEARLRARVVEPAVEKARQAIESTAAWQSYARTHAEAMERKNKIDAQVMRLEGVRLGREALRKPPTSNASRTEEILRLDREEREAREEISRLEAEQTACWTVLNSDYQRLSAEAMKLAKQALADAEVAAREGLDELVAEMVAAVSGLAEEIGLRTATLLPGRLRDVEREIEGLIPQASGHFPRGLAKVNAQPQREFSNESALVYS